MLQMRIVEFDTLLLPQQLLLKPFCVCLHQHESTLIQM